MSQSPASSAEAMNAIRHSCIPLLCGEKARVLRIARFIRRRYGVVSYAFYTDKAPLFGGILAYPFVRTVHVSRFSPQIFTDAATQFFDSLSAAALPVCIDCTENAVLFRNDACKASLECRCFFTDAEHLCDIPPFCYCSAK